MSVQGWIEMRLGSRIRHIVRTPKGYIFMALDKKAVVMAHDRLHDDLADDLEPDAELEMLVEYLDSAPVGQWYALYRPSDQAAPVPRVKAPYEYKIVPVEGGALFAGDRNGVARAL